MIRGIGLTKEYRFLDPIAKFCNQGDHRLGETNPIVICLIWGALGLCRPCIAPR